MSVSLQLDADTGLISSGQYIASPHCDDRAAGSVIDLLVIHGISLPPGEFGTGAIADFFTGKLDKSQHPYYEEITQLRVSAHFLIQRDGALIQFVPVHQRAWHAGESSFQGRDRCNDFSIGIEMEGTDDKEYTNEQYMCLARLTQLLITQYPDITKDRIVGHCDIAPGRKTDPGEAFDWIYYRGLLDKEC